VVHLIERSEYKRQQAAPVLKVTSKSFGMGRRFPIAVKVQSLINRCAHVPQQMTGTCAVISLAPL
jgi:hypothetical protein